MPHRKDLRARSRNPFSIAVPKAAARLPVDHCDQFNDRRIYRSLRLLATLPRISDSEREVTGVKLRAIITAMVIALATPAFADISDYESMHRRLADVLGSRAQADAAYDKLMQEANTYGQPIDSVVDLFIELCTASDECNP
jgi:hypothetical protein